MRQTLVLSDRGQITLPAAVRKRYGIKSGDVMILEERGNELILKPAAVMEIEIYDDTQIAEWDAQDALSKEDRKRVAKALRSAS